MASMLTVTTRPRARRAAMVPPARSICDSVQPPKMAPPALVSAGMAMVRRDGPPGTSGIRATIASSFGAPVSARQLVPGVALGIGCLLRVRLCPLGSGGGAAAWHLVVGRLARQSSGVWCDIRLVGSAWRAHGRRAGTLLRHGWNRIGRA